MTKQEKVGVFYTALQDFARNPADHFLQCEEDHFQLTNGMLQMFADRIGSQAEYAHAH